MHNLEWSRAEKAVAHAAFRAALAREMASIRDEVETMFQRSADPFGIWDVHDFLSTKRRAIDEKYDYRYSVLILVFGRLLHEGWARESELDGLSAEKMDLIRRVLAFARERDVASAPDQEPARRRSRRQRDRS